MNKVFEGTVMGSDEDILAPRVLGIVSLMWTMVSKTKQPMTFL